MGARAAPAAIKASIASVMAVLTSGAELSWWSSRRRCWGDGVCRVVRSGGGEDGRTAGERARVMALGRKRRPTGEAWVMPKEMGKRNKPFLCVIGGSCG
jgi:hypothetical protein